MPTDLPSGDIIAAKPVSFSALFMAFSKIGLCGFGGVAAWAHRILVDEHQWYSDKEYAELLSVGSVLPGPNICNMSILVGDQFKGPSGSAVALMGLLSGPLLILIALATIYEKYGDLPLVQAVIAGITAAAAGLIIGTVLKLARRLRPTIGNSAIGALVFVASAIFHIHVALIVVIMIPVSIGLTLWERRR